MYAAPENLIPVTAEELRLHLAIALKVIRPRIQFGQGRKLPHQSDAAANGAADALVEHFATSGWQVFRKPPVRGHSTPDASGKPSED